jgi:hypothetical protein
MALTFAARQTVKMISGFAPDAIIMTAHGINHIEKALLIAQRFGKLSASIAAYRTAVRLRPLSETGQTRTSSLGAARPLPPSADIGPGGQSVGQAAQFCLAPSQAAHQASDNKHNPIHRSREAMA